MINHVNQCPYSTNPCVAREGRSILRTRAELPFRDTCCFLLSLPGASFSPSLREASKDPATSLNLRKKDMVSVGVWTGL